MGNNYRIRTARFSFHLSFPVFVFLLTPFFKPGSLSTLAPVVDTLFDLWIIVASVAILFLYLANGKLSKIVLSVIVFELALSISTFLNSGDIRGLAIYVLRTIPLCMLVEIGVKQAPKTLIKAFIFVLGIECAINSITILAFPAGMYVNDSVIGWNHTENYFLAYDNIHIMYLLPLLSCLWIYCTCEKRSLLLVTGMALFSVTVYISWSATSVIGITAFLFIFIFSEFHIFTKLLELKKYILVTAAAFVCVVIFRVQNQFADIIANVLGKDISFTGRTTVWDRVLYEISQRPVLGEGFQTALFDYTLIGAPHAHNLYLQILYQGGIVAFGCFLMVLLMLFKPLKEYRKNKYCFILSASIFCYLLISMAESYGSMMMGFWVSIVMAYHIKSLTAGLEKPDKKRTRCRIVLRQGVRRGGIRRTAEQTYLPK